MTDWLIVVPAWGERCLTALCEATLPALQVGLSRVTGSVRWVVHTDQPNRVRAALGRADLELRKVPGGSAPHGKLGEAHRDALAMARDGEAIALFCADMVGSIEIFEAAEKRFAEGKRCIVMAGTRTLSDQRPPVGASSRELLKWAWRNRHPWIKATTWGEGKSRTQSLLHFQRNENVVLHGFHLHPFAVLNQGKITFPGVTIDRDLIEQFPREQVHVVTSADEAGFAEMSPAERTFADGPDRISTESIADWAALRHNASATHRWLFTHRICLCGEDADIGDAEVCADILATIERWEKFGPPMTREEQKRQERKRRRDMIHARRLALAASRRR